jgi:peptidase M23-like protein
MIVYGLLFLTFLFAGFSLVLAYKTTIHHLMENIPRLFLAVSSALFIYLYGTWVFVSIYSKYVFGISFVALLARSSITGNKRQVNNKVQRTVQLFFALVFISLSVLYFTGTTGSPYGVARLSLPFKTGNYFVFQGGNGLPTNLFHYKLRGAVYAMDIVKLNSFGNRAKHIFSTKLQDYEIYGDTLYSPCNGRVAHTETDNPDNIPPSTKRGPKNTNYILIETDSFYVFMAHLKPGCVFVHEGQQVTIGQPIACCGNSGFSIEPHLHIQAHARTNTGLPWYKEKPLLITFNDKHYHLFEIIR